MKLSSVLLTAGGLGIAFASIGLMLDRLYPPQLHFTELPAQAHITAHGIPQQITIPELAIDLPIKQGGIVNGKWSIAATTANYLQTSARPGSKGNIVIYGHDDRVVLGSLKKALIGQNIMLYDSGGTERTYAIEAIYAVAPTDISPIQPTDEEILTVYTCTGLFNEQRLIIRAKPTKA